MKELIELVARSLVDRPDEVEVAEVPDGSGVCYELKVAPDDVGKVIGKQGRLARALRTVVAAAGAKQKKRVAVEIIE